MFWQKPGKLMLLSAVIGIFGTVVYSVGLILVNHVYLRRQLPDSMRSGKASLFIAIFVAACYFALAACYTTVKFLY